MKKLDTYVAEVCSMELTRKGRFYRINLKPHKRYNTVEKTWVTPRDVNLMGIRVGCRVRYATIDGRIRIRGVCREKKNREWIGGGNAE